MEFEHLVRELFEATGMQSWVTQPSRDEGVNAVATNPDPVLGGLCVIQAKRYKGIGRLEAVHALAGVMHDKAAAKGILVTTSWFGKASRTFAARNGRIQLIDGRNLKAMMHDKRARDVLIGLPRLPLDWHATTSHGQSPRSSRTRTIHRGPDVAHAFRARCGPYECRATACTATARPSDSRGYPHAREVVVWRISAGRRARGGGGHRGALAGCGRRRQPVAHR